MVNMRNRMIRILALAFMMTAAFAFAEDSLTVAEFHRRPEVPKQAATEHSMPARESGEKVYTDTAAPLRTRGTDHTEPEGGNLFGTSGSDDQAGRSAMYAPAKADIMDDDSEEAELICTGKYDGAEETFETLGQYSDNVSGDGGSQASPTPEPSATVTLSSMLTITPAPTPIPVFHVGDTVLLGRYEQDNDRSNGKEDIEWVVLSNNGSSATLISKYCLESGAYDEDLTNVNWRHSDLMWWLNDGFLNAAFSKDEQKSLVEVSVSPDENPKYRSVSQGKARKCRVFLLSALEAEIYYTSDAERIAYPTEYLKEKVHVDAQSGGCWWWLRTVGKGPQYAVRVRSANGEIVYDGKEVTSTGGGVRPVIVVRFPENDQTQKRTYYIANVQNSVNLRKEASEKAAILAEVPRGAVVLSTGEISGDFMRVEYDGKTGYIHQKYLFNALLDW